MPGIGHGTQGADAQTAPRTHMQMWARSQTSARQQCSTQGNCKHDKADRDNAATATAAQPSTLATGQAHSNANR
eukprot:15434575-Alexandrium_andersonii.AAC.2